MSSGGDDDWYQRYLKRQERERQHSEHLAEYVLPLLRFLQVRKVRIPFDGSGDEGWTQPPEFDGQVAGLLPLGLDKFLEQACEYALPGGWEINSGSFGSWTIDVDEGKTDLDHTWRDEEDEDEFVDEEDFDDEDTDEDPDQE